MTRLMPYRLAMRRNCSYVFLRDSSFSNRGYRRVSEPLPEVEVEPGILRWCGARERALQSCSLLLCVVAHCESQQLRRYSCVGCWSEAHDSGRDSIERRA